MKSISHVLLLFILIALAYSNTLDSPFLYDDDIAIISNRALHMRELSSESLQKVVVESYSRQRVVANVTFAFNYLFGRLDTTGFHIVNIFIHMLASLGVYLLILELLRQWEGYGKYDSWIAFVVAGLWAVHPVQTSAVTYIVQRMTILAGLFYVFSFYFYIKGRKRSDRRLFVFMGLSLLCWIFAMGSKEIAATLPGVILMYEFFFYAGDSKKEMRRLVVLSLFMGLGLFLFLYVFFDYRNPIAVILQYSTGGATISDEDFSLGTRLLTNTRILLYYVSLILFPHPSRQMIIYSYMPSSSLFAPFTTFISTVVLAGVVAFAFRVKKCFSFFILWFFITISIESGLFRLHLVFEHRLYLPSIGLFALLVIAGFDLIAEKWKKQYFYFLYGVGILFLMLAYNRNSVWESKISVYGDNVLKNTKSASLHNNLAKAYQEVENWEDAEKHQKLSIGLNDRNPDHFSNLGGIYLDQKRYDEAMEQFRYAYNISPKDPTIHLRIGITYFETGLYDKAIKYFDSSIGYDKENYAPYYNLGGIYLERRDWKKALLNFDLALKYNPDFYKINYNTGLLYLNRGMFKEAVSQFEITLQKMVEPVVEEDFGIFVNYGIALFNLKDPKGAIKQLDRAIVLMPAAPAPYFYKGLVYLNQDDFEHSITMFEKAKQVGYGNGDSLGELAFAYFKVGKFQSSLDELKQISDNGSLHKKAGDFNSGYELAGNIYLASKQYALADKAFSKAIEIKGYTSDILFKLGMINGFSLGFKKRAEKFFQMFLSTGADNKKEMDIAKKYLASI